MIKEYIAEASTIEAAQSLAKQGLAAPETAEVKYEVLAQPKKKTLGLFGGSPARVRAYYNAPDPAPKAPEKKPQPAEKKTEEPKTAPAAPKAKPAAKSAEKKPAKPAEEPQAVSAPEQPVAAAQELPAAEDDSLAAYLKNVITLMGLEDVSLTYSLEGKSITYNIACSGDQGLLIGRRGETLDALQYLARLAANRDGKDYDRVSINVGNYREKRESSLRALAKRSASQVLKYGRNVSLEPMNPYERRLIHTAIQEIEGVQSFSVGSDSSRRVVIALEEGVTPTHPSRGGYNNRGRGGRPNGGRGRGGYNNSRSRSSAYTPRESADQTPRTPKNDAAGSGLYGKIEVKKTDSAE